MQRFVDHVLCKLPFEVVWYRERGCHATYVGHPYFDQLRGETLDAKFVESQKSAAGPLVAILPGSRTQEVRSNTRALLKAAREISKKIPNVRFAVAAYKPAHAEWVKSQVASAQVPIDVHVGRTAELIHAADCAMAVSGSVSLELLYHLTPTVILYQVSKLAYFVQRFFRKVRYITLVNLLTADDLFPRRVVAYDPKSPADANVLMPEYIACNDQSAQVAMHVVEWLTIPEQRAALVARMAALREEVGQGGASRRAAEYMLRELGNRKRPRLTTHHSFAERPVDAARTAA
jgi:lipid-A-disaccharide synthase